jgi:Ran GTPase-activating protein (RanGAP) involved in mRNA processing and transport
MTTMTFEDYTRALGFGYQMPDVRYVYDLNNDDDVVRRLSANDPAIDALDMDLILDDDDYTDEDLRILGLAISSSKYLRTLECRHVGLYRPDCLSLLMWIAHNRSIEYFRWDEIHNIDGLDHIADCLVPFIMNNHNLRSINFSGCDEFILPPLVFALKKSIPNRLTQIQVHRCGIKDDQAKVLINVLSAMPGLCYLLDLDLGYNRIERMGCEALAELLTNSSCKIQVLRLSHNDIDDVCIEILINALIKNNSVKALDLSCQRFVTPIGWRTLSGYLSNPNCALQMIDLHDNPTIRDENIISFGESLAVNTALRMKFFDLSYCTSITSAGWNGFATWLRAPYSAPEEVDLVCCNIDDEGIVELLSASAESSSVKALRMVHNHTITSAGWTRCFQKLLVSRSESSLEKLSLTHSTMDDYGATLLMNWMVRRCKSLTTLNLGGNHSISASGWVGNFHALADSDLKLVELILSSIKIDDDWVALMIDLLVKMSTLVRLDLGYTSITTYGMKAVIDCLHSTSPSKLKELKIAISFTLGIAVDDVFPGLAAALAHNTDLERLFYNYGYDCYDDETNLSSSWSEMATALCDNSSIAAIYSSNHSTFTVEVFRWTLPYEITFLLETNYNKNKFEVFRTKILKFYFSDVAKIGPAFDDLPLTLFPDAIAWIGSDYLGFSTLYHLLRGEPSIFRFAQPYNT